jgi:hypothetical protein
MADVTITTTGFQVQLDLLRLVDCYMYYELLLQQDSEPLHTTSIQPLYHLEIVRQEHDRSKATIQQLKGLHGT